VQPISGKNQSAQCRNRILACLDRHAPEGKWVKLNWVKNMSNVLRDCGPEIVNRTLKAMAFNGEIKLNKENERPRLIRQLSDSN
jgi:hypothetical protein